MVSSLSIIPHSAGPLSILLGTLKQVSEFFEHHLALAGLLASGSWFYAGHQYLRGGSLTAGLLWQLIGAIILLTVFITALVQEDWSGSILLFSGLCLEIWAMSRFRSAINSPKREQ